MNRKPQSLKQSLKQPAPPLSFAAFQFPAFLMDKGKLKEKPTENTSRSAFSMPVVGVEPTRVISTRDFEFLSSSSIWCHPVISSDIWFPLCKGKIHASTNNNLKYPRFSDAFPSTLFFGLDRPNGNWRDVQEGCRAKRSSA